MKREKRIEINAIKTLKGHSSKITCLDFDERRNLIFSSGWDGTIQIWNVNLNLRYTVQIGGKLSYFVLLKSTDRHRDFILVSIKSKMGIELWNWKSLKRICVFDGSFSRPQTILLLQPPLFLAGDMQGNIGFFTLKEKLFERNQNYNNNIYDNDYEEEDNDDDESKIPIEFPIHKMKCETGNCFSTCILRLHCNSEFLSGGGSNDYRIYRYNYRTYEQIGYYEGLTKWVNVLRTFLKETSITSSSKATTTKKVEEFLISGGYEGVICIWNVESYELIHRVKGSEFGLSGIIWSVLPLINQMILVGDSKGTLVCYEYLIEKEREEEPSSKSVLLEKIQLHNQWLKFLIWIDNDRFCSGGYDHDLKICCVRGKDLEVFGRAQQHKHFQYYYHNHRENKEKWDVSWMFGKTFGSKNWWFNKDKIRIEDEKERRSFVTHLGEYSQEDSQRIILEVGMFIWKSYKKERKVIQIPRTFCVMS